ncbi:MAG TPA: ATP-binding protein [Acidimicrobiales bacterium]|nr:ATP-binding protein [Acidimicrobiales bacterium]
MERSVLQGLAAFRWAAWAWMAIVLVVSPGRLVRPWLAYLLVGIAFAFTAACTQLWRRRPEVLLHPAMVVGELAIGASLLVFDGLVRPEDTVFSTGQSLGSVWPLTGVISAGVAFGPWVGAAAGILLGVFRYVSTVLNRVTTYDAGRGLSLTNTTVFYAMAGGVFGYVVVLLTRAREEVAAARAREEVARTLHDGVLQTLALVERRATDPALSRLAREQERDLRAYLFGDRQAPPEDLGAALRRAAGRFEETYGGRVTVLVPDDLHAVGPAAAEALAGAVGEALTNAGKHGPAHRVVVYVEEGDDGGLFCSVKDDGPGFDAAVTRPGIGITRSIRGRMQAVGGEVVIVAEPGGGTEVQLRLPRAGVSR